MNGIIVIDKPQAYTSHDIVAIVKKKLGEKVGHTGTLDPNATGVLPLLIGKGTKLSGYLIDHDKTYEVELKFGEKTDTADGEGKILETREVPASVWKQVSGVLASFQGRQKQMPPMYSAIKVKGKKLYEYARSGKEVAIPEREIEIFAIHLEKQNTEKQEITFMVHCSKGTYIRSLCEDIAEKLGTVGYMKNLRRKTVGKFTLEDAITLDTFEKMTVEDIRAKMRIAEEVLQDKPKCLLPENKFQLFCNGVKLSQQEIGQDLTDGTYRIYVKEIFVGLGIAKEGSIKREWLEKESIDD